MGFWKLIKVDLKIKYNTIFNSHSTLNKTDKITVFIFILLLIIFPLEFSIIKNYPTLSALNLENIILNMILNIEIIIISIITIIGIINNFFLESDIFNLWFYPIKSKDIFFSKCFLEYLKGLMISLIGLVLLITFGILKNWTIYYYFKAITLTLLIPIICIFIIFNFFLFISLFFSSTKKFLLNKIFFCIVQFLNIIYIYFYIINNKIDFYNFFNFIPKLFLNKISIDYFLLFIIITNITLLIFYTSDIYLDVILSGSKFKFLQTKSKITNNKNFKFKSHNLIISLISRDLKEILRTPILFANAIIPNIIFFLFIILVTSNISNVIKSTEFFLMFIVVILSVTMTSFNTIGTFAFSRETNNLKLLNFLPFNNKHFFISKLSIALLFNIINLISINILIIIINNNILNIILLNTIVIFTMISTILINITTDFTSTKKSILNLSEVFNNIELMLKPLVKIMPLILIYSITFIFISRVNFSYKFKGIFLISIYLLINIFSITLSYRKIKKLSKTNEY